MKYGKIRKIKDAFPNLKRKIKGSFFYYTLRDAIFKKEIKNEKKIEFKYGTNGIIEYTKKWYKQATGSELNLDSPSTLTEKQQWLKIFDRDPLKPVLSDKYKARKIIGEKIGENHLVPIIKINGIDHFSNAKDIDFDKLPNQFVISCNHGSSMSFIVKDKSRLSKTRIKKIKNTLNRWLKMDVAYISAFDFTYKGIEPCLVIFEYIENSEGDLPDYKFLCFNGTPKFLWIDTGRFANHKRTMLNLDFTQANFSYGLFPSDSKIQKPQNYDLMLKIVETLCQGFKFVRVDLYNVNGIIYFGEMTFSSGGGTDMPNPPESNKMLGELLVLN